MRYHDALENAIILFFSNKRISYEAMKIISDDLAKVDGSPRYNYYKEMTKFLKKYIPYSELEESLKEIKGLTKKDPTTKLYEKFFEEI